MSLTPDDRYSVRNTEIEQKMKELAIRLKSEMPEGWGFTLLIFEFGGPGTSLFYISSAEREDMMNVMREFINRNTM